MDYLIQFPTIGKSTIILVQCGPEWAAIGVKDGTPVLGPIAQAKKFRGFGHALDWMTSNTPPDVLDAIRQKYMEGA